MFPLICLTQGSGSDWDKKISSKSFARSHPSIIKVSKAKGIRSVGIGSKAHFPLKQCVRVCVCGCGIWSQKWRGGINKSCP